MRSGLDAEAVTRLVLPLRRLRVYVIGYLFRCCNVLHLLGLDFVLAIRDLKSL
jgi:hypothetical protein